MDTTFHLNCGHTCNRKEFEIEIEREFPASSRMSGPKRFLKQLERPKCPVCRQYISYEILKEFEVILRRDWIKEEKAWKERNKASTAQPQPQARPALEVAAMNFLQSKGMLQFLETDWGLVATVGGGLLVCFVILFVI